MKTFVRVTTGLKTRLPKQREAPMARVRKTLSERSSRAIDSLSPKENTIINCVVHGWHDREIAHQLCIAEQTVRKHLRLIYATAGVSNRMELVLYALHEHLDLPLLNPINLSPTSAL